MNVFLECVMLAAEAHRDDVRMGNHTPYFMHCLAVTQLHRAIFGCDDEHELGDDMIHDVEEDHGDIYPFDVIVQRVGERASRSWCALGVQVQTACEHG